MASLSRCSSRRRRSARRERRAFTLIELLVVISIILLLAALIMPTLGRASRQARGAQCVSNLRQLGDAFRIYANTFKGRLPGTYGCGTPTWLMNPDPHTNHPLAWENSPHKGQLFPFYQDADLVKCPADGDGNGKFSYGTPINIRYRLIQNAEEPARTPLVLDEHERYCIGGYVGPNPSPPRREAGFACIDRPGLRHDARTGVGFFDGHAELRRYPPGMQANEFDIKPWGHPCGRDWTP